MATHKGQINMDMRFNVDKSNLQLVKNELQDIQKLTTLELSSKSLNVTKEQLAQVKYAADAVQTAMEKAFNVNLGTLNITKFQNELTKAGFSLDEIYSRLSSVGAGGMKAFQNISSSILTSNLQLKQTSKILDNIAQTMVNTAKWGAASGIFNNLANSVQKAWNYTVKLDTSLNNIRVVSKKSAEEMERFARQANAAAQKLGTSTRDYTNAALIYYQQGLSDQEVKARADVTLKAANVTGQSGEDTSKQLTAIWNGYKVSAAESELYIDKVAKVAASTSADLKEMATAMSKVAAAAKTSGVDIDRLNGMIATVVSTTREAPESIGTSFRTIFARLGDLKMGKTDEDGVGLGTVSTKLQEVGVQILDQTGNMRNMGDIIDDIAKKWNNWNQAQKQSAAIALAGQRQYSRFMSLFENWDMYTQAVNTSKDAVGELQSEQDIYMESTAAHLKQLDAAWEKLFKAFSDKGASNGIIDLFAGLTNGTANWVEALGGGTNVLLTLGAVATQVFSKQIASGITSMTERFSIAEKNAEALRKKIQSIEELDSITKGRDAGTSSKKKYLNELQPLMGDMNPSQLNELFRLIDNAGNAQSELQQFQTGKKDSANFARAVLKQQGFGQLIGKNFNKDIFNEDSKIGSVYINAIVDEQDKIMDLTTSFSELEKARIKYDEALNNGKNEDLIIEKYEKLEEVLNDTKKGLKELSSRETLGSDVTKQADKLYNQLNKIQKPNQWATLDGYKATKGIADFQNQVKSEILNRSDSVDKYRSDYDEKNIKDNLQEKKEVLDNFLNAFYEDKANRVLTNMISSVGQLITGFNALARVPKIWNNEDLSVGEKALQIIMALGSGVGLLFNSVKTFITDGKDMLVILKGIVQGIAKKGAEASIEVASSLAVTKANDLERVSEEKLAASKGKTALAKGAKNAAGGVESLGKAATGANGALLSLGSSIGTSLAAIIPWVAGIAAVGAAIYGLVKWYNKDKDAAAESEKQAKKTAESYQKVKAAAESLTSTLEKYNKLTDSIAQLEKGTVQWKKAILDANEEALKLLSTYQGLAAYATRDSNGVIKISKEGQDKILDQQYKQLQSLAIDNANAQSKAIEKKQISNRTDFNRTHGGVSEGITSDILNYMSANNISKLSSIDLNKVSSFTNATDDVKNAILKNITDYNNLGKQVRETKQQQKLYADEIRDARLKLTLGENGKESTSGKIATQDFYDSLNNNKVQKDKDVQAKIKELALNKLTGDKDWESLSQATKDDILNRKASAVGALGWKVSALDDKAFKSENYVKQLAAARGFDDTATMKKNFWGNEYTFTQGKNTWKYSGNAIEDLAKQQVEEEYAKAAQNKMTEAQKALTNSLQSSDTSLLKDNSNILSNIILAAKSGDFSQANQFLSQKQAQQLNGLDNYNSLAQLKGNISQDTLESKGYNSFEDFFVQLRTFLKERGSQTDSSVLGEDTTKKYSEGIRNVANQFQEGKLSSSLQTADYTALQSNLEQLKNLYPELITYINVFNDKNLIGTEQWTESLEKIREKLNELRLDKLGEESNQAVEQTKEAFSDLFETINGEFKIKPDADIEGFKAQLDNLLDKDYKINIEIHAQAEDAFNSFEHAAKNIETMSSKIGENFVVAADDVRALNNTFPGIVEGMEIVKDGSVKLKDSVVQNAVASAKAEIANSAQSTIQQLTNQYNILRTKEKTYRAMQAAALALSKGEGDAAALSAQIKEGFNEIEQLNTKAKDSMKMSSAQKVARDSQKQAGVVAENWGEAYDESAKAAIAFGQTAISAMRAAQTGNPGDLKKNDYNVRYRGKNAASSEAIELEDLKKSSENAKTSEAYAALAQSFERAAVATGAQATDIQGMIYQIGAQSHKLNHGLSNVARGKGFSPKKESGKKDKEPNTIDELKEVADRYHEVDTQIQLIGKHLSLLESQQKKMFGDDLISNYHAQLSKINDEIGQYNRKVRIAKDETAELKSKLAGSGVTFNGDGTINNYIAAFNAQQSHVNSLVARYNSMGADAQKGYKKVVEKAKEDFKKFQQNLNRYDDLVSNVVPELEKKIQDAIDKQIEIRVQEFNMEIKIRLDMSEAERNWNEFKRRVIDNIKDTDILGNAKAKLSNFHSYYKGDGTGVIQKNTTHVNNIIDELKIMERGGRSSIYGDNQTKALEDLKTYYNQLMTSLKDIRQIQDDTHNSYLKKIDEVNGKFNDQVKMYEQIQNIINHNMKVIQLISGDQVYGKLKEYYDKQEQNYNKSLDFQRQQVAFWKQQMATMEQGSEEWEKAKKNWIDAVNTWEKTVKEAIENVKNKFKNAIGDIFERLNNKVTKGWGLQYVNEQWGLINKNADQYLDTVNSMYGIRDLEKKYKEAIDKTDNVAAQRKLNNLMREEVAALRAKDKLTKYDVERAERKYQIALAQLALDEAKQNKSKMRLRRDSQGNYSYQFVADNDAIGEAQNKLDALKNELYNFDLSRYKDNLDKIYSTWDEYQKKMAEAALINDPQRRAERELLLNEQYEKLINGLVEQNNTVRVNLHESAFDELANLYKINLENYTSMTNAQQDELLNNLIPQWRSGVQQMADVFAGEGGFVPTCRDAMQELEDVTRQYQTGLEDLQTSAGFSYNEILNGIDRTIEQTQNLLSNNSDLIDKYGDELQAVRTLLDELKNLTNQYESARIAAIGATEAAYKYWQFRNSNAANAAAGRGSSSGSSSSSSSSIYSGSGSSSSIGSGSGSGNGGGAGFGGRDGVISVGDRVTYSGRYYYDSRGTRVTGSMYSGVTDGVIIDRINNNPYGVHIYSADGRYRNLGWVKRSQISGYDTGGYTGEWGNNGRLAFLHQKELVLNSEDTKNILNAVGIIRGLENSMLNNMTRIMSGAVSPRIGAAAHQLEQNVRIEAHFPNATKASEIEEAMNNLINIAAQRSQRK